MSTNYEIRFGWNRAETQEMTVGAEDFRAACIDARRTLGKAWSVVIVRDPLTDQELDVAVKYSHGKIDPAEWVTAMLAPPVEVAIVSIASFLAALQPSVTDVAGNPNERPVWILLNGMLYAPAQIGVDPQFGAIIIVPSEAPAARHSTPGPTE